MKVLIIGSLPPPIGGTSVSFQNLVTDLRDIKEHQFSILDVGKFRKKRNQLPLLFKSLKMIVSSDHVSIQLGIGALSLWGLVWVFFAKLTSKKISIRRFGGQLVFQQSALIIKSLELIYKNSSFVLCQTLNQNSEAREIGVARAIWFPTARPQPLEFNPTFDPKCENFVFISQVKESKGILLLIKVFEDLRLMYPNIRLDIYGPLFDGIAAKQLTGGNYKYHGVLEPIDVNQVLINSDVLVLPTYYEGEGYPGILIEAMLLKKYIVTTRWKSIPELVLDAALLVEVKSDEALQSGIEELINDAALKSTLFDNMDVRRKRFVQETQTNDFLKALREE